MSKQPDEFGDRMKQYEGVEAQRRFMPGLPICARIDGRGFSKFTSGFEKPFDPFLTKAMRGATQWLVEQTHAAIGYTQSDEISLIFTPNTEDSQGFFAGRIQKMASVLAGMATVKFNHILMETHEEIVRRRLPLFDARVWQVPSMAEATNTLLWRAQDAKKNGISAACRSMFSAKAMHGKSQKDMLVMMDEAGCYYETAYAWQDRLGVFFRREKFEAQIEQAVWDQIPEASRSTMSQTVIRSRVVPMAITRPLTEVYDRPGVLFGTTPIEYAGDNHITLDPTGV
jgi:tRNA(His) guanylyltransferase